MGNKRERVPRIPPLVPLPEAVENLLALHSLVARASGLTIPSPGFFIYPVSDPTMYVYMRAEMTLDAWVAAVNCWESYYGNGSAGPMPPAP
jgi:hypothetical protein